MDLALNNLQRLICHKTKPHHTKLKLKTCHIDDLYSSTSMHTTTLSGTNLKCTFTKMINFCFSLVIYSCRSASIYFTFEVLLFEVYFFVHISLSSSSHADSTDSLDSLAIRPHCPLLLAGPLDGIQCLYKTDFYVFAGYPTLMCLCVVAH